MTAKPNNIILLACEAGKLNGIRRMGFSKEEMTIHGFRAMFSTILNEKKPEWGFDADIIEAQPAGKVIHFGKIG